MNKLPASPSNRNLFSLSSASILLLLAALACNLPGANLETPNAVVSPAAPAVTEAIEVVAPPDEDGNPTPAPGGGGLPTSIISNDGGEGTGGPGDGPTPAPWQRRPLLVPFTESPPLAGVGNLPPADISFQIDCSALPNRQAECDAYAQRTRDLVYPNLRDLTGISLANCFTVMQYTILPGDVVESGVGGRSDYDKISYGETGSLDYGPGNAPYDVHELVHSFDACSGAFTGGGHMLMGMMENAIFGRLGIREMPYFQQEADTLNDYNSLIAQSQSPTVLDIYTICQNIIGERATLAYFHYGDPAVRRIYQSAIAHQPHSQPNAVFASVFGSDALPMLAIVEALEKEFGAPMNVPACGF